MGFIKFVLILLIIYYAFKLIAIYLVPFFLKRFFRKMSSNFGDQVPGRNSTSGKKDGSVTIDYAPEKKKTESTENIGEYVDYEEVK